MDSNITPEQLHRLKITEKLTLYLKLFPQSKLDSVGLAIYSKALEPLSINQIEIALTKLMRISKYFPSVAEIFEQADIMVKVVNKSEDKSPDEAWNEVQRQMQEAYIYKKPVFSTKEIEKAALSMGWIGLCETETKDIGTIRAQFNNMYKSVLQRKKESGINNDIVNSLPQEKVQALLTNTVKAIGGK